MSDLTFEWRPGPGIRAKSIAILSRDTRILVSAVTNDSGQIIGWRPPGGTIEFGERAAETLLRELREELDAEAEVVGHLGVLENLYEHHGVPGHEIIFVFEASLLTKGIAGPERFILEDGGFRDQAAWIDIGEFGPGGETLLPHGLLDLVPGAFPA